MLQNRLRSCGAFFACGASENYGIIKAVIHARYSSDSQCEESIEGQLRECTAFAEKNGITVLRHLINSIEDYFSKLKA